MKKYLLFILLFLCFLFIRQVMAVNDNTCFDSDGGEDFFTKGHIEGVNDGESFYFEDFCADSSALSEYYCLEQGLGEARGSYPRDTGESCKVGCSNGACIPIEQNFSIEDAVGPNFPLGVKYDGNIDLWKDFSTKLIVRENDENGDLICEINKRYHIRPVKRGETLKISGCISMTADRLFYIKIIIDENNEIKETNENDNVLEKIIGQDTGQTNLSGIKPDLLISPGSLKINNEHMVEKGEYLLNYITFNYINDSDKKIEESGYKIKTEIFIDSLSSSVAYEGEVISSSPNSLINAKGYAFKNELILGKKYIVRITIDSENIINESNENNNTAILEFIYGGSSKNIEALEETTVINDIPISAIPVSAEENASKVEINQSQAIKIKNAYKYSRLKGKILLKVQDSGKAYYVNPQTESMYYLGRPKDAFDVMRGQGVGVTNDDLNKIPVASESIKSLYSVDSDKDGYSDGQELENGYNPNGLGKIMIDNNFSSKHLGKIFLQVESVGEAWYVNPTDQKRYFLGRPQDAFNVMRNLGLGISNADFEDF